MHKIVYTKNSRTNLQDISAYISLDNPFQAKKVLDNIYDGIKYLEMFPYLWKERGVDSGK